MTAVLEASLAWLFKNAKGRDAKSFYTGSAFADFKEQTIDVTSPDCGPSNSTLAVEYTHDGTGRIPSLQWKAPEAIAAQVKEWLVVVEDPDAPLPTPICHGIYAGIPPSKTLLEPRDFEVAEEKKYLLKGGFYYGAARQAGVYLPPRPLMNHGIHRYFFEVVALSEPLDSEMLKARVTREQVAESIKGKVLGWGMWVGSCERKWK